MLAFFVRNVIMSEAKRTVFSVTISKLKDAPGAVTECEVARFKANCALKKIPIGEAVAVLVRREAKKEISK